MDDRGVPEPAETEAEVQRGTGDDHEVSAAESNRPRPCERELVVGRKHAPAHVVGERGIRADSTNARTSASAPAQYTSPPTMRTGLRAPATSAATWATVVGIRLGPRERRRVGGCGYLGRGRAPAVERDVDERRAAVRSSSGAQRRVERDGQARRVEAGRGVLGHGRDERDVVELLQRALTPPRFRRAPADARTPVSRSTTRSSSH